MKVRQDAWTEEDDLLLAETVLRHVREGSTQLNAFEEVGDKLNRTSAACGFRWNAVVRHNYEKALQLAKKQRKQRQRILGNDQNGKKKLLYSPPEPSVEEIETITTVVASTMPEMNEIYSMEMAEEIPTPTSLSTIPTSTPVHTQEVYSSGVNLNTVISYLQNLNRSDLQVDILKSENERLKRELAELRGKNKELETKLGQMEQDTITIQEDYETLMKIMNRARKLALFDEEERPATTFKMDRNGNLEKVAE